MQVIEEDDLSRIVIWGGAGFVGRHLVEHLKGRHHVTVIERSVDMVPASWKQEDGILVVGQEDIDKLEQADVMYFLAWNGTSGDLRGDVDVQLANIRLACSAVEAAAKLHCQRFVYAGSIMEYEAIEFLNKDGNVPGLNYLYSASKLTADYYAKILANSLGIVYCNALISNIYGPGEVSQRFVVTMCRRLMNHEDIALTEGTQLYDFIYISDAVEALSCIGTAGKSNCTYYIGNKEQKPLRQYIEQMKELLGSRSKLQFGAVGFSGVALTYKEFDTHKLYDELGFQCKVGFAEGISKTADWLGGYSEWSS